MPPRETLKTYVAVDFAVSENKGDYTAIVAFGVDPASDIFVLDVWRRQATPDVSVERAARHDARLQAARRGDRGRRTEERHRAVPKRAHEPARALRGQRLYS
jgi:hypothetical protein